MTSNTFDPISSITAMASFFRSSLLMFKEMLFPDNISFKLENLIRVVLYLILTPVAFVVILVLMVVVGLEVTLLVFLMKNTFAENINQVMAKIYTYACMDELDMDDEVMENTLAPWLMAEVNMNQLDMDDFEEAVIEEEKPKIRAKKGRNARRRKNRMQAAKRPGKDKSFELEGNGKTTENLERAKVEPKLVRRGGEGQVAEKTKGLRMKLSQLEKEERMEKDAFCNIEDEVKEMETAMRMLMNRKASGSKRSKANEKTIAKVDVVKKAQKKSLEAKRLESIEKLAKIQNEIKTVKQELKAAESGGKVMSKDLEAFLEREIKDLEDELECPVCLEVAKTAPIYKCEDDHLICRFQTKINHKSPSLSNVNQS